PRGLKRPPAVVFGIYSPSRSGAGSSRLELERTSGSLAKSESIRPLSGLGRGGRGDGRLSGIADQLLTTLIAFVEGDTQENLPPANGRGREHFVADALFCQNVEAGWIGLEDEVIAGFAHRMDAVTDEDRRGTEVPAKASLPA